MRAVERVRGRLGRQAAARRFRSALSGPGRVLTRVAGEWVVAEAPLADDPTRANLDLALAVARDAGVPVLALPGRDPEKTLIGVAVTDRHAFLDALRRDASSSAVYVRPPGRSACHISDMALGTEPPRSIRVFAYRRGGGFVQGARYACVVEFYMRTAAGFEFTTANTVAERVPVDVHEAVLDVRGVSLPTLDPLARTKRALDVSFPIDVVYTWVDTEDPEWRRKRQAEIEASGEMRVHAVGPSRHTSHDELRYSMRSLHRFAPWVGTIFIVTAGHWPPWLNYEHPQIRLVRHDEIFADRSALPTFNSHAIEAQLHRIPGLSQHYLYLNDDVFLGRDVTPDMFFHANGITKFFLSNQHLDLGPPHGDEPSVMSAAKRHRELLAERFGVTITDKVLHAPHPQNRVVLEEIEEAFGAEVSATTHARFRDPSDLSVASALHHYYAFLTGRAVPAPLSYGYLDTVWPDLDARLHRLLRRREWYAFCINDSVADQRQLAVAWRSAETFLETYFPERSPWER